MNFKFLIVMCMAFLLVGTVSALEFDNVKDYDAIKREVTITNAYGLGDVIGKARLNTPLNVKVAPGYRKVAEFDISAYQDYNDAIKQFTFTDMKKKEKINRDFDLKYLSYENVEIEDYENKIISYTENGTAIYKSVLIGSHTESRKVWTKVTPADLKKNEVLTIGIFTEVEIGDFVDWIPTIYGVEIEEWATWEADIGTTAHYNKDATSGDVLDSLGNYDGTNNGATRGATGKISNAFSYDGSNDYVSITDINNLLSITEGMVSFWIYPESITTSPVQALVSADGSYDFYVNIDSDQATCSATGGMVIKVGTKIVCANAGNINEWKHIIVTWDSTNIYTYTNGASTYKDTKAGSNFDGSTFYFGSNAGSNAFKGRLDEVLFADTNATKDIVDFLYNDGDGLTYLDNGVNDDAPVITLNSPTSANYTTAQTPTINLTASDDINLADVKLYVNTILNQTNASGDNATDYLFNLNLGDGDYAIYGKATDNNSQETNSNEIRIVIDSIAPTINITSPTENLTTFMQPINVLLNATTFDTHLETCLYYTSENTTNITYTCNTTINISLSGGEKTIYVLANDSFGNTNEEETTILINYIQENAIYDTSVIEQENYTVALNITASQINTINGSLNYNGVEYNTTISQTGNTAILTTNLTAPSLSENLIAGFNWTYNLNGVDYNSSNYEQTIFELTPLFFSESCNDKALKFELQDEGNLSSLTGDVEFNFKYGISNSTANEVFGSLSEVSTFYACINATVAPNYTIGYGEIQYRDADYVDRRYYLFEGRVISNNTLANITLRDLKSVDQTSFLLTMEDTSLNVYSDRYTALWRWYPDLNEYQIVEMGKTDEDGQTVTHVETEDVDYRVGLYEQDGTLIKLDNPRRFVCTSAPCSLTIRVGAGDVDYSSVFDVQAEITYNETSGVFLLIYNDPNQLTSKMRFLVTRETGTSTLIICNDTSSGFSGAMSCNTSAYNGLKRAVAFRSASPELPIAQKVVSQLNTTFNSGFGLFISVILWLAIVLSGFGNNPIWTIILSVVGLIPALIIGSINIAIFTGIAVLGAILIHFIKRTVAR